ncbi:MAG: glycosyltransferase [Pseudomonadales bacterium]|nr:glycosyltransferase [Pseudomonadales bacterium]
MKRLQILQLCHDTKGPFKSICRQYASAFGGHQVTTVFLKGTPEAGLAEVIGCDEVIFFEQQKLALRGIKLSSILQLVRLCRQRRFDVVVGHRYKAIYLIGMMSYFYTPLMIAVAHEHNVFRRITRRLFVTFWRRSFVVVGVSSSVRQNIADYCPSLELENRLFALPNAIDTSQEGRLYARNEARQQLGIPTDEFVFGIIGRLVEKKNHALLFAAFALFCKQCKGHLPKLVVIGDGPAEAELKATVQRLGLTQQVVFSGYQPDAMLTVKAFDTLILSSGEEEAFGLVLLEAMLGKVAIICSDARGPKSVVGATGMLFRSGNVADLAEKIMQMFNLSQAERQQMAMAGYERMHMEYSYARFEHQIWRLPGLAELAGPD